MKKCDLKDFQLCQDMSYKNKVIVRILSDADSGMPHVTVVSGDTRMQSYITDRDNLKPV
ncbi:TPA: hypothetical protein ACPVZG_004158 [Vibrio parahaemolyticus]